MSKLRALIADDDLDLLDAVSRIVHELDVDVSKASSGGELLERLADDGPFDVILTDVSMPWMTGLHVVHSARAAGSRCPVIVMTALRDHKTSEQVLALGEDVILLRKPFSVAELRTALQSSVAR